MERLTVVVYYDFASCLCYVAHRVMERLAPTMEELAIDLDWTGLDLTCLTGWRRGDEISADRREGILRVSRQLEVPLTIPRRWMDSRPALATALLLANGEQEARWRQAVWTAVYDQGADLEDDRTLGRLLEQLELDPFPEAEAPSELESSLKTLAGHTHAAIAAGVSGVPTFMLDEWPVGGIQEDETMRHFLSRWAAKKRHGGTYVGGTFSVH